MAGSIEGCTSYMYQNTSCGPSHVGVSAICEALQCRNMLVVGDSTTAQLFAALANMAEGGADWHGPGQPTQRACAPVGLPQGSARFKCAGCRGPVTVSFQRHDILVGRLFAYHATGGGGTHCPWIHLLRDRDDRPATLTLPDGAPLPEYSVVMLQYGVHINNFAAGWPKQRPDWPPHEQCFHAQRADELVRILRPLRKDVIWLPAYCGADPPIRQEQTPLIEPRPCTTAFNYHLLDRQNALYYQRLKRGESSDVRSIVCSPLGALPAEFRFAAMHCRLRPPALAPTQPCHSAGSDVSQPYGWTSMRNPLFRDAVAGLGATMIDHRRAMAMRPDCRKDYIHFNRAYIYVKMTWLMFRHTMVRKRNTQLAAAAGANASTKALL